MKNLCVHKKRTPLKTAINVALKITFILGSRSSNIFLSSPNVNGAYEFIVTIDKHTAVHNPSAKEHNFSFCTCLCRKHSTKWNFGSKLSRIFCFKQMDGKKFSLFLFIISLNHKNCIFVSVLHKKLLCFLYFFIKSAIWSGKMEMTSLSKCECEPKKWVKSGYWNLVKKDRMIVIWRESSS